MLNSKCQNRINVNAWMQVFLYLRIIVRSDERGTLRHLETVPKDEQDLWRSTTLLLMSWLISYDFLKDVMQ